jgi:signal transduction histidine kinase/CheY-like chemotaxis protein
MADSRLPEILETLQDLAAGDMQRRIAISAAHDEIDAIAYAINAVAGELNFTTQQLRRARDEAQRASEAKTVFLRNVSHELRTPLSAILGMAQLLQKPGLSEARRHDLCAKIITNALAQAELLDDLVDLSQVEAGKMSIELQPLAADAVLAEVINSMEFAAERKGLVLIHEPPRSAPGDLTVHADRRRLRQILVNVIGNAIKFTSSGKVLGCVRREGRDVLIDITDTGIGIEPALVSHLFEPFTQAAPGIGASFGGSGLGLALARGLARQMAGDLAITDTAPHAGTTFRLRLPAVAGCKPVAIAAPAAQITAPQRALEGVRVLLADDERDLRMAIAALLAANGAAVCEASCGSEAIELGRRDDVHVILLDIRMPDIDGLEVSRRLRALGVRTPIAALTADVAAQLHHQYAEAGIDVQLAKPISIGRLVSEIRHLLAGVAR